MNLNLKNWTYRLEIRRALRAPSPAHIHLSLPRAAANNFFEVNVLGHGKETKGFGIPGRDKGRYTEIYFPMFYFLALPITGTPA
jgi:hypothetical protein